MQPIGPVEPARRGGSEHTEHIFDSMVSVRSQQMQQQPHLGLGLYIVRLVCDYHKGTVTAYNNEQGNGVVFTVSLPLSN